MAYAGWVGLLVTSLNLMPVGQLDGGHILYTLLRRKAHVVAWLFLASAIAAMVVFHITEWTLMILLLLFIGPRHPPTADDNVPLGFGRIALGWLTLAFLAVGFTPKPFDIIPDREPRPPVQQEQPHQREDSSELIEVQTTPRTNTGGQPQVTGATGVARIWSRADQVPSNLVTAEPKNRQLGVVLAKF